MNVVETTGAVDWTAPLASRIRSAQEQVSPRRVSILQQRIALRNRKYSTHDYDERLKQLAEWILLPAGFMRFAGKDVSVAVNCFSGRREGNCMAEYISVDGNNEGFVFREVIGRNSWAVIESASRFVREPGKEALARVAELPSFIKSGRDIDGLKFPWPVHSIIEDFKEGCSISTLVAEAREGRFGDLDDWINAEKRWGALGLRAEDFLQWNVGRYLSPKIGEIGAPALIDLGWATAAELPREALDYEVAFGLVQRIGPVRKREPIMDALISGIGAVSDAVLRTAVVDYMVNQIGNYAENKWLVHRLAFTLEAWDNPVFLELMVPYAAAHDMFLPRRVIFDTNVELNGRWRKLLPMFVDRYLEEGAKSDSEFRPPCRSCILRKTMRIWRM